MFSAVLAGLAPCGTQLALQAEIPPLILLTLRFATLAFFLLLSSRLHGPYRPLPRAASAAVLGLGLLITAENALYLLALKFSPVSVVTPLFFTYPAIVSSVQAMKNRVRPSGSFLLALVLALAGVSLTVWSTRTPFHPLGILFALTGGGACAAMLLLAEASMAQYGEQEMLRGMASVAIPMSALAAVLGEPIRDSIPFVGWLGVLLSCLLYAGSAVMFFGGMGRVGASAAALISTLEPAVAVLAGVLLLREPSSWTSLLGTAVILIALLLIVCEPAKRPPA
jgi:drug/metabolite transporter (DMT)-like permease